MSDDEEREPNVAVLRADPGLKTKQGFWETPRHIGILMGVVAAVAGALGFRFGREAMPVATPVTTQLAPGVVVAPGTPGKQSTFVAAGDESR